MIITKFKSEKRLGHLEPLYQLVMIGHVESKIPQQK